MRRLVSMDCVSTRAPAPFTEAGSSLSFVLFDPAVRDIMEPRRVTCERAFHIHIARATKAAPPSLGLLLVFTRLEDTIRYGTHTRVACDSVNNGER